MIVNGRIDSLKDSWALEEYGLLNSMSKFRKCLGKSQCEKEY